MRLPLIDLTPLHAPPPDEGIGPGDAGPALAADASAVQLVAQALDEACSETGFFVVEGHGIPTDVRDAVFAAARALFDLPDAAKEAVAIGLSPCHRGYVGVARETLEMLDVGAPADLKEAFDLSRDLGPDHPEVSAGTPLYGPNQWPELEGFRTAVEAYYDAAFAAALAVCRGLALGLGLHAEYFTERMTDSVTNLRLLHYPPSTVRQPEPGQPGCGSHTDYGLVTLLAVDDVGGLEVRHRNGDWVPIDTAPGQLVVNIGDMMAHWSAGRWVSTLHRVRTPADRHRYSVPFFVNPNFHTVIEQIPWEGAASEPAAPVTAGAYLLNLFDSTHAYRT